MKKINLMILFCIFSGAYISTSYGEGKCFSEKYHGDDKSFSDFIDKCKKDWPKPIMIGYYNPDSTNAISGKDNDGIRYAHWLPEPEKRKGVVVHFNGRTEFIEKNIYTYKDLLDKGFEVWSFDWRGQGFSKREEINDKQKHNIKSFDRYLNDVIYFINNIVNLKEVKGKKILLAHSMGGQIALRYLLDNKVKNTFDYAVLSSPLLRIPSDSRSIRSINSLKLRANKGNNCIGSENRKIKDIPILKKLFHSSVWVSYFKNHKSCELMGKATDDALDPSTNTKWYSNDLNKNADIDCLIKSSQDANGADSPDLRLGCPTSNWLHAAFESTDLVMKKASELNTKTLIVRALPDNAVDNAAQDEFCKLTNNCTIISIGVVGGVQTGHELLIEQEPIRKIFFELFDGFVGI